MTTERAHILITNDDGLVAPGLMALAEALSKVGRLSIVAPNRNWSASGHAKTMHKPLRADQGALPNNMPAVVTTGCPADAISLGLMGLAEGPVDLVVTGINSGANLGHDVTYSGTVTAAMEGTIAGIPSFAISLDSKEPEADYGVAAAFAAQLAQVLLQRGLPANTLLNANVPALPPTQIKGVKITRMGLRIYRDELIHRTDPFGRPYYWIGGEPPTGVPDSGTDVWALEEGYISVTPLQLDFTAYPLVEELANWDLQPPQDVT